MGSEEVTALPPGEIILGVPRRFFDKPRRSVLGAPRRFLVDGFALTSVRAPRVPPGVLGARIARLGNQNDTLKA